MEKRDDPHIENQNVTLPEEQYMQQPRNDKNFLSRIPSPGFIKLLDWYIIKKFLSTFFFAILILAVISCVIDYSEKVDNIVSKKASFAEVANYYKNFIPHITALLFPLFIFIATIFFTSKLAYKSEIIAILAGGVSFQRFMRPYIIGGVFLGLISLAANHWVIPNANKQRIAFEDKYINDGNFGSDHNVHVRLTPELYIYVQNYDYKANLGYHFTAEKIHGTDLKEKLTADHVSYDSVTRIWHLNNVTIRTNDSIKESFVRRDKMDITYANFSPKDLHEDVAIKEALTTPELNRFIEQERLRGSENLNQYFVEMHRRSAQPFAGLILTIIGACLASRKIRGGSGFHLALGIAISALYIMFLQLSTTFSTKSSLSPFLAVWIPNIVFGLVALYLFRRQTK